MYDMYPEWGPAKHRPETSSTDQTRPTTADWREDAGERPDDN